MKPEKNNHSHASQRDGSKTHDKIDSKFIDSCLCCSSGSDKKNNHSPKEQTNFRENDQGASGTLAYSDDKTAPADFKEEI